MKVRIVGRGRVGRGLACWLEQGELEQSESEENDLEVELLAGRTIAKTVAQLAKQRESNAHPKGETVFLLAVPDGHIAPVAQCIRQHFPKAILLHCAGRLGVEAYGDLAGPGLGALHPLVSFASPKFAPPGDGYGFAISGDRQALRVAKKLVATMNGVALPRLHGPAYHAAAALVANGGAALALLGIDMLRGLGLSPKKSRQAMGALLRSVAHNVEHLGMPRALTGPVARGDVDAVQAHRQALSKKDRRGYDRAGALILAAAQRAGLHATKARKLKALFQP